MTVYRFNKSTNKVEVLRDQHPAYVRAFLPTPSWRILSGKRRKASPQAHSDPVDGAGGGAGGAPAFLTGISQQIASTFVYTTPARGGGRSVTPADYSKLMSQWLYPLHEPPTIPYAGVRSGEIIAWRLWWVIDNKLCSWAHQHTWKPGKVVQGDIKAVVDGNSFNPIFGGVYGFKEMEQAALDANRTLDMLHEQIRYYGRSSLTYMSGWNPLSETSTFALGSIALWGEVIEHETGWRGEFAKVNSIDTLYTIPTTDTEVHPPPSIHNLRRIYGLAPTP